jgi:hypothetical protein
VTALVGRGHHLGGQEVHRADEIGHLPRLRAAIQRFGIGQLGDLAFEHHGDAVGHDQRLFLVMRDQDEGDADLPLQLDQFDLHVLAHLLVERGQRFVQQQHLGLQDQRARQRHALPLPARQRMGRALAVALQPHHLQRLGHRARLVGRATRDRGAGRSPRSRHVRCGKIA